MVNTGLLKLQLQEDLTTNYSSVVKYTEHEFKIFYDFEPIIRESIKCLIFRLNFATITITNHLLERLLKLALILKVVGIRPKALTELNNIFAEPSKKYSSITLGNSIEQCFNEDLINVEEKEFLFEFVRELLRNGFSHADAKKILSELSDDMKYYKANSLNTDWEEVLLNPKIIPQLQAQHIDSFANENAVFYFDYVFHLMKRMEDRLVNFERQKAAL